MENPVFELFLALGIIIAASKLAGSTSRHFGQPRVFGELLVGVILGPTLINFLHLPFFHEGNITHISDSIHELAEIGVLLLMFKVGLEVHVRELLRVGKVAILAGSIGAIAPVLLTLGAMAPFNHNADVRLFVGVTLAATSVSISAQTLLELGLLRTKEGFALLAAALVDDVLAILLLSFAVATTGLGAEAGTGSSIPTILVKMTLYIVGAGLVAWFVVPPALNRIDNMSRVQGTAAMGLVLAFVFGWSAEVLGGVAAITGAFIAGVGVSQARDSVKHKIEEAVTHIAYAFLVPIFFVNVGLSTDLKRIGVHAFPLAIVLILVAIFSKLGGVGLGARLGGFTNKEALRLGVGMISRGEVGLIIASVGLTAGIFSEELFPTLFLVILLSTVITPPLVRLVFKQQSAEAAVASTAQSKEAVHG